MNNKKTVLQTEFSYSQSEGKESIQQNGANVIKQSFLIFQFVFIKIYI